MESCELNINGCVFTALLCHCVGTLPFQCLRGCTCAVVCASLWLSLCVLTWDVPYQQGPFAQVLCWVALIFNSSSPHLLSLAADTPLCHSLSESSPTFSEYISSYSLAYTSGSLCLYHIRRHHFFFSPIIPLSLSSLSFIHGCFFFSGSTKPRLLRKASEIVCRPWNRVM